MTHDVDSCHGPAVHLTRRRLLQTAACGTLGWALGFHGPGPQRVAAAATPALEPLNRFPTVLQRYFTERIRAADLQNRRAYDGLQTRADAEAYVRAVREKIRACFGPLPDKTPLNPRITGVIDRDQYRIEKVIFESQPEFFVTANLYVPKGRTFPLPGVVGSCGHSANGKAYESYQSFAQGLARMGYVVLIYDPIGQGERLQYAGEDHESRVGVGVAEHLHAGNQQFLVGEFFGTWRAWDGIRALDYLLTRSEVDPQHVGITGNSGGGTLTTWLCGLDQRWTMAAPGCFVTTFRRNLENELPQDTEQCPPRALALAMDHADFLAALAPKPVIILTKERDYFDVRGSEETYGRLKRLYALLGAERNIALFTGPTGHGYSQESREAMYQWFNRVTGVSDATREPVLTLEKDDTLACAPRGQVRELRSRTVFSFTAARSRDLSGRRQPPAGPALRAAVAAVLKLPPRTEPPDYRILRDLPERDYPLPRFITYALETEPHVQTLVYHLGREPLSSRPARGVKRAVLYVAHRSSDAELRGEPLVGQLLKDEPDAAFFACDVRGIGESQPNTCGWNQFLLPYGSDYFYAAHAIMLDYPLLGQRTHDVLRTLDWLVAAGHGEVHLAGNGWGAIPAALAAVLADQVVQVTLKNALRSFTEVAETEDYRWPLSLLPPGVLKEFDLPDCYRALVAKNLRQFDPLDARASVHRP